jgi:peptidoglycan/LPS O-acetylase OafA/YrhL
LKLFPDYSKRVYGLDVYRAIAILLVVQVHGSFMLNDTFLDGFPWIRLTDGVELFFVLSGFLIGGILLKIIHRNDYKITLPDVSNFWKRRWYRTLPNYFLILLLNFLFVKYGLINGDLANFSYSFFLFLHNFATPFYGFFWESWSLSIEEWFYIILPLSLFISLKVAPNQKGILSVIIILILAPLVYRISQTGREVDLFHWDTQFRKVIVMRLDTIIYGVLAAYIKFYYDKFWIKIAKPAFFIGLALTLCIPYLPLNPNAFFTKTFFFNATSFAAMLMLPLADQKRGFKTGFGKVITHISLISYSMYLINLGLVVGVINKHFPIASPTDGLLKYTIYWGIVIIASTLLYKFFEKPIMELREKSIFKKK